MPYDDEPGSHLINTDYSKKLRNDNFSDHNDQNDIVKLDNMKTTETDLHFGLLANDEKLFETIKPFDKHNDTDTDSRHSRHSRKDSDRRRTDSDRDKDRDRDRDRDRTKSDDLDDYVTRDSKNPYKNGSNYPSEGGPSYGGGSSRDDKGDSHRTSHGSHGSHGSSEDYNTSYKDSRSDSMKESEFRTEEDEMLAKLDMLRKLGELTQYGVKLSQNYNMGSDFKTMKYEYELHKSIRDKHNGIKWMSNMLVNVCYGVEIANDKFNPFDFHLKGWSEQMNEDSDSYYDVFGELYEKYFKTGKPIPPELKLFLMISGSAVKFHLAHSMINKLPNLGQMLNNNPEMAEKLRQQASADKLKEQGDKQRDSFNNKAANYHDEARQRAEDLQLLREQEAEFYRMKQAEQGQRMVFNQGPQGMQGHNPGLNSQGNNGYPGYQMANKQSELDELQRQLNAQRSDSRSMYSQQQGQGPYPPPQQRTMRAPVLPSSLRKPVASMGTPISSLSQGLHMSGQQQEQIRQQQILDQKQAWYDKGSDKDRSRDKGDHASVVNFNPDMDSIIDSKFKDMESNASDNSSAYTDNSKLSFSKRRGGKKKKSAIKINT